MTWVQAFGVEAPEIPHHRGAFAVGIRIAFLGMDKIRELLGVFDKENGSVVAHHVPVAFFGIEFNGKAAGIAFGIGRTFFRHPRWKEADEDAGLLAQLVEYFGAGVLTGDIAGNGKCSECAAALGMYYALGDTLAVEMGHLFVQDKVLQQQWPAWLPALNVSFIIIIRYTEAVVNFFLRS